MTRTLQSKDSNRTYKAITQEQIEPYLRFPSGLSLKQAKVNAKRLKKDQDISQHEAMKCICWGNGLTQVRDFSQAFELLMESTFKRKSNQMGLAYEGDQVVGYFWYSPEDDNFQIYGSRPIPSKRYNHEQKLGREIKMLVDMVTSLNNAPVKEAKFLDAIKRCINKIGHHFYSTKDGVPLELVNDKHHIYIDLDALLYSTGGSGGETLLSYALASCYNTRATACSLMERALEIKYKNDERKDFDISIAEDREDLSEYYSEYRHFGAMCYNLDDNSKQIIKDLLDNYHGW